MRELWTGTFRIPIRAAEGTIVGTTCWERGVRPQRARGNLFRLQMMVRLLHHSGHWTWLSGKRNTFRLVSRGAAKAKGWNGEGLMLVREGLETLALDMRSMVA